LVAGFCRVAKLLQYRKNSPALVRLLTCIKPSADYRALASHAAFTLLRDIPSRGKKLRDRNLHAARHSVAWQKFLRIQRMSVTLHRF
jgi:hypothetical protein